MMEKAIRFLGFHHGIAHFDPYSYCADRNRQGAFCDDRLRRAVDVDSHSGLTWLICSC